MSDSVPSPDQGASAGALLRRAREAAGMELGTLSATIKVAQRKLEALEGDRYNELPDAVFTRALALTVCRALKADAAPVLALLPEAKEAPGLEHVTQGLNQPFDERGSVVGRALTGGWGSLFRLGVLAPLLLMVGAAGVYFWPDRPRIATEVLAPSEPASASAPIVVSEGASESSTTTPADADASNVPPHMGEPPAVAISPNAGEFPASVAVQAPSMATSAPASRPAAAVQRVAPVASSAAAGGRPASAIAPAAASTAAAMASAPARLPVSAVSPASAGAPIGSDSVTMQAKEDSWVDVRDAKGRVLVSRLVRAGESLTLTGTAPLQVKVGNARGTELQFRGRAVDLPALTRDNVVRLELK